MHQLAFTQGLDDAQLQRIAQIATPVSWDAGTVIFREGDRNDMLYLVDQGRVAIAMSVPGREAMTILTVGPGEVFGWSSVFYRRPKTASARVVDATKAWALDAHRLRELCDADPKMGYLLTRRILQAVSERLKTSRLQLLDLFGAGPGAAGNGPVT